MLLCCLYPSAPTLGSCLGLARAAKLFSCEWEKLSLLPTKKCKPDTERVLELAAPYKDALSLADHRLSPFQDGPSNLFSDKIEIYIILT